MTVSVVIPVFNGKNFLEKNLPGLVKALNYKKNNIIEIIAVDDGSIDESAEIIKKDFEEVTLIKHKENKGFVEAVNTGFNAAKGDLVCLLNQDVKVSEKFLEKALPHFKNEKVFGVSLHEKGYGWANGEFKDGYIVHEPGSESEKVHSTFWLSGGSSVIRKSIWKKLKGMDDLYKPFYWEDVDISYRALKRGYTLLWEPKATVVHQHESTINKNNFNRRKIMLVKERNHLLFNWKNITSPIMIRKHLIGLAIRTLKNPGYLIVVFMSLARLSVVLKRRKIEKRECRVSDEAVLTKY